MRALCLRLPDFERTDDRSDLHRSPVRLPGDGASPDAVALLEPGITWLDALVLRWSRLDYVRGLGQHPASRPETEALGRLPVCRLTGHEILAPAPGRCRPEAEDNHRAGAGRHAAGASWDEKPWVSGISRSGR